MGNEVEKVTMQESDDQKINDPSSTDAVGPGPLPSNISVSDSDEQSQSDNMKYPLSSLPNPPSPSQLRSSRRRQNRIFSKSSNDINSTAAVMGPSLTMNTTMSKDDSFVMYRPATAPPLQTLSSPHLHSVSFAPVAATSLSGMGGSAKSRISTSESKPSPAVEVGPELEIEDGTPAAEAIKANAQIKVSKVGKAARYMNAQTIKRVINQPKIWNRKSTGNKRGKPPRVPEIVRRWSDNDVIVDNVRAELNKIVEDDENEYEQESIGRKSGNESLSDLFGSSSLTHGSDLKELSTRPFRELAKSGNEDDPDATYVGYDVGQAPSIILHDRHGKKQEIKMFGKMKKRRKERKESRSYVKGKTIQAEHELYTLSIAVMLGLRYAIYQTHRQLEHDKQEKRFWLDSEEFMRMEKYVFRPDGRHNTPPHKLGHTFKFKDYSPVPFAYIRRMFGINEYEFIHSVCGNANFIEFISNAKSGQFFFYSSDGKYMIKTMTNTESKFLRRILPHYFRHCAQNPSTLMTKFLGMYRVKLYHLQRNVKFVVMNSVFDTDKMISSFYDLKGSTLGRQAKPQESVKKDNDVRRIIQKDPNGGFILPPAVKERMREQVIRDCNFLKEMKIMDYSMLIGVHYIPSKSATSGDSIRGLVFRDSESVRSSGMKKKTPHMIKKDQNPLDRSLLTAPRQSPRVGNVSPPRSSVRKVEFLLDEDVLENELLEERPIDYLYRGNISFNLNELDERISIDQQSLLSACSTLGFDEEEDMGQSEFHPPVIDVSKSPGSETSHLDWRKERLEVDIRREMAIEQSYWPFHRHYEINGQRRVIPIKSIYRHSVEEEDLTNTQGSGCGSWLCDSKKFDPDLNAARLKWQLKDFEKPISDRKDNGFTMDVTDIELPMNVTVGKEKLECDGKIFYMGIIDILQQFNVRKRMEARLRRLKGGWDAASCVHPNLYANRFVNFFDEYTQRGGAGSPPGSKLHSHDEEISFMNHSY